MAEIFSYRRGEGLSDRLARLKTTTDSNFVELARLAGLDPKNHFKYSNWSGANFVGCDLTGFDFTGSDLSNCDFQGAILGNAIFENAITDGSNLTAIRAATIQIESAKNDSRFASGQKRASISMDPARRRGAMLYWAWGAIAAAFTGIILAGSSLLFEVRSNLFRVGHSYEILKQEHDLALKRLSENDKYIKRLNEDLQKATALLNKINNSADTFSENVGINFSGLEQFKFPELNFSPDVFDSKALGQNQWEIEQSKIKPLENGLAYSPIPGTQLSQLLSEPPPGLMESTLSRPGLMESTIAGYTNKHASKDNK